MSDLVEEKYSVTVLRDRQTGRARAMVIRLGGPLGKIHSPPDGRPAHVLFDEQERVTQMAWYHENVYHRTDGPALMQINPETGVVFYEEYRIHGKTHRSRSEPAWTERDPVTGKVQEEHYFMDDESVEPVSPKLHAQAPSPKHPSP